ncbi:MAG: hypothetical protein CBE00_08515 [Planctomycetaceae bacterium TMED240]|nr:MAG: hypothetical protein CBE00_08515 [Planctomycetaceae bacterium TMED240]
MITKIKDFWIKSYTSDKIAFYFEMASFIFTVGASLTLAVNADQPDMRYVYPGFFIGSITAVYAYIRRQMAWPLVLTSYFAVVNVLGFSVAMGWS